MTKSETTERLRRLIANWRAEAKFWEDAHPGDDEYAGYVDKETARSLTECADRLEAVLAGKEDVSEEQAPPPPNLFSFLRGRE